MNLTRALDVALPEIPARVQARTCPRLHPNVVFKEHIADGRPLVRLYVPGVEAMFNLEPETWKVVRFFDGQRSYEQVAEAYSQETGTPISVEEVHDVADYLEAVEFWYKTPREKNIAWMQQSAEERKNAFRRKSRWTDLSMITFPAFNPDKFLIWLERRIRFVFTWWFTLLTLAVFAAMAGLIFSHWGEFGRDTLQLYTFTDKTAWDLVVFWGITLILSAVHEAAHGVTCRHFGGGVDAMGFALIYLSPAFYTDTTQGVVLCEPFERILISIAGVWSEMYICVFATCAWWLTPPGTATHEIAYIFMLMTGLATTLINLNPLMKLDGYHILCSAIGILDLKENSTAYVSAWVKRQVFGLPVEVPYVPKRRRLGFAVYAIVSGLYSYTVLYIVVRFVGNICRHFSPEWAFIPQLAVAALIFRSRIRSLVNFMKFVYLDKRDWVRSWFTSGHLRWVLAAAVIFVFLPLWHESISGRFVLEAAERAVIRAEQPGTVVGVYADEGQTVSSGAPLVKLSNLPLASKLARSDADYRLATAELGSAGLHYAGMGAALQKRDQLAQQNRMATSEMATLQLRSPIAGVVTTARLADRLGSYVTPGTELAEVADLGTMRARIYVSEYEMYKYRADSRVRLYVEGTFHKWEARSPTASPASAEVAEGLVDLSKYKGLNPPKFYELSVLVRNGEGTLSPGMVGTARVYGNRHSIAGFAYRSAADALGRKFW